MKTAIECLTENDINILAFPDNYLEYIKAAMQEYAQQEAIEFARWKEKNYARIDGLYLSVNHRTNPINIVNSVDELYKLYQDEKLKDDKG